MYRGLKALVTQSVGYGIRVPSGLIDVLIYTTFQVPGLYTILYQHLGWDMGDFMFGYVQYLMKA